MINKSFYKHRKFIHKNRNLAENYASNNASNMMKSINN